jgi:hypothetical protein
VTESQLYSYFLRDCYDPTPVFLQMFDDQEDMYVECFYAFIQAKEKNVGIIILDLGKQDN